MVTKRQPLKMKDWPLQRRKITLKRQEQWIGTSVGYHWEATPLHLLPSPMKESSWFLCGNRKEHLRI